MMDIDRQMAVIKRGVAELIDEKEQIGRASCRERV